MIEEQADTDLKSAVSTYNRLAQQVFPDLRIGLLHGSLKTDAKDQVMQAFMQGEIQILVSTTVIEVGVDNPNANLMLIENAERFGLAQLHQLRGRIGRGEHQALCILLSDSQDEKAVAAACAVDRKTVSKSRKKIWVARWRIFRHTANTVFRL